jgi:predicted Rossmann fold nucleotide-binding protein DprA/Smf involved in DNA uptake
MADSLLKSISSSKYRRHLQNNNLALISSFNPEAGFSTGNAMQRNKYIYCMSQAAIAVHSGTSGGTWTGANENLSKGWTPLWTKHSSDPDSGNQLLVKAGAYLIQDSIDQIEIADLIGRSADVHRYFVEVSEVNEIAQSTHSSESHHFIDSKDLQSNLDILNINSPQKVSESHEKLVSEQVEQKSEPANDSTTITQGNEPVLDTSKFDFYEFFLTKVASWCSAKSCDLEELESLSGVSKPQLTTWVKRAVQEGHLVKQSRPVKYLWSSSQQSNLFG